ncbi:MAG: dihydroorotase [Lentisphaerae bacterium]|nr:dihydroorotase [Lentisphaerota bacterium]
MKEYLLKNVRLIDPGRKIDQVCDLGIAGNLMTPAEQLKNPEVLDMTGKVAAPGFIDLHVHLRQPGNTAAETIASGTAAAAAGGFTSVVAMPNTSPAADTPGAIEYLKSIANSKGVVRVLASGCMTKNLAGEEMAPIGGLKSAGVVALTDDGKCIQNSALMRHVMEYAKSFNLPIMDHCEEKNMAAGGVMHEGKWSVLLGFKGMHALAEELIVARDIMLARTIDWYVHLQHISTAESVRMVRDARQRNIKVSAEATPHHIALNDECIKSFDTNYKMNPPLRSEADRLALLEGLADGTITVIATDHAPHTATSKTVEFDYAPFGIIGLETAVPVTLTELVHSGVLTLEQWVAKFTTGPAEVLLMDDYTLADGKVADITVIDPDLEFTVDKNTFRSLSCNTPFDGKKCRGKAVGTMVDGVWVYREF